MSLFGKGKKQGEWPLERRCDMVRVWAENHKWKTVSQGFAYLKGDKDAAPTDKEIEEMKKGNFAFMYPLVEINIGEDWVRYRETVAHSSIEGKGFDMNRFYNYMKDKKYKTYQLMVFEDGESAIEHRTVLPKIPDDIFEHFMISLLFSIMESSREHRSEIIDFAKMLKHASDGGDSSMLYR